MTQYLNELEALHVPTFSEYKKDSTKRYAVERLIELIVEFATDINRHFASVLSESSPPTYYDTFAEMHNMGILTKDLATKLASTTGLRNRLVHRYEEIDHKVVYRSINPLLENYRK
ncbi:MAG: DUF86 domain-containing protein, partial [Chloroflexi bacterium]|nr:DUF86 domain-containing protein [Chloroflexota bacterium]